MTDNKNAKTVLKSLLVWSAVLPSLILALMSALKFGMFLFGIFTPVGFFTILLSTLAMWGSVMLVLSIAYLFGEPD